MSWIVEYLPEAKDDLQKLDHAAQVQVLKGIDKVAQNPLPRQNGGYGKPLGHKGNLNLTTLLKIKFRDLGIRVVYKLQYTNVAMKIVVISARADEQVYRIAASRKNDHKL